MSYSSSFYAYVHVLVFERRPLSVGLPAMCWEVWKERQPSAVTLPPFTVCKCDKICSRTQIRYNDKALSRSCISTALGWEHRDKQTHLWFGHIRRNQQTTAKSVCEDCQTWKSDEHLCGRWKSHTRWIKRKRRKKKNNVEKYHMHADDDKEQYMIVVALLLLLRYVFYFGMQYVFILL